MGVAIHAELFKPTQKKIPTVRENETFFSFYYGVMIQNERAMRAQSR